MIKRIRPVTRVARIEGEIPRLLRQALSGSRENLDLQGGWIPLFDIWETRDDLVVMTEVPGLAVKDVVISLSLNRIEIKGVKQEAPLSASTRFLRLEREYGAFHRAVPLPCAVVPDKAKAYLENGVLTIRIKKLRGGRDRDFVVKIRNTEE